MCNKRNLGAYFPGFVAPLNNEFISTSLVFHTTTGMIYSETYLCQISHDACKASEQADFFLYTYNTS